MPDPCNYDILNNYKYATKYQYTSIELRDTEEEKLSSEMLVCVLNIGFLPDHCTLEFMRDQKIPQRSSMSKQARPSATINDEFERV